MVATSPSCPDRDSDYDGEIYVMKLRQDGSGGALAAGTIRNLTDHSADDYSPTWSPDGRHIAFLSERDGNREIYVMGSDGSNLRRVTTDGGGSPSLGHRMAATSPSRTAGRFT